MLTAPLHHFYIIEGNEETHESLITHLENSHGVAIQGNPDLYVRIEESFGIDESRALKDFLTTRSFGNENQVNKKIAIVTVSRMTREAQNALLKISEEPAVGQHIILIVPALSMLLDTIRSRAYSIESAESTKPLKIDFLALSVPERLKVVQKYITKKDRHAAAQFIDQLISQLKLKNNSKKDHRALSEALTTRLYIQDQSSSLKLILEHISLILPT